MTTAQHDSHLFDQLEPILRQMTRLDDIFEVYDRTAQLNTLTTNPFLLPFLKKITLRKIRERLGQDEPDSLPMEKGE